MINDELESSMNYQNSISPIYTRSPLFIYFPSRACYNLASQRCSLNCLLNRPLYKLDQAELLLKSSFVSGVYVSIMHKARLYISAYTLSQKRGFTDRQS